jgi:hypothetical protein
MFKKYKEGVFAEGSRVRFVELSPEWQLSMAITFSTVNEYPLLYLVRAEDLQRF